MREKKQIDYIKARAAPFSIERKKSKRQAKERPETEIPTRQFPTHLPNAHSGEQDAMKKTN